MAYNITFVLTQHQENGVCTADALFKIIDSINPEVIFEELPLNQYKEAYVDKTLNNLESVAIRKYAATLDIIHIPVDTYERPKNYEHDQNLLYSRLTQSAGVHSFHLRELLNQKDSAIYQFGFRFLNSDENEKFFEKMDTIKERVLEILSDEYLNRMAHRYNWYIQKREDVILNNIYHYCKENTFEKALMFIGSGHQKSIKKKIEERGKTEGRNINWSYYSDLITASKV